MTLPTLLDIAKRSGNDAVAGLIEEVIAATPEVSGMHAVPGKGWVQIPNVAAARTIKGRMYKTLVRTALPTVGFRDANEGVAASKSEYENRLVETFVLNPRWECDKAVADNAEDGPEAYIADEAIAVVKSSIMTLGRQFYYGRTSPGDGKGHPGLIDSLDATNMEVDATGTSQGKGSSVWAVKFGPQDVTWVYGDQGQLDMSDVRLESIADESGKRFTAYVQELLAYPGLQVGNKHCIGRIRDLTDENGKGLTDDLIAQLIEKFPAGVVPDVLFMTRRSLAQLRNSRTATNATGAPAPYPVDWEGIPIAVTDSLTNTEDPV